MRIYLRRLVAWLHAWLVVPTAMAWEHVLGTWEEVAMGLIRQTFQDCTRFLNGLSSWLLSFFQRDYRESLRRSWEHNPWHSWWHHAQARPSTLNALIAATQQQEQKEQADAAAAEGAPPPSDWTSGLTHMFSGGGGPRPSPSLSSKHGEEQSPGLQRSRSWRSWLGQQQHESPRQGDFHPSEAAGSTGPSRARGAATSGTRGPTPAASAPPMGGPAGGGPSGRPVIFVQQSGMGILESLKRTGLLEDTRLAIELRVSQAFDWARRTLRAACYLPPPPSSPHAFARATRQQPLQQRGPQPRMPAPAPTAQSSMLSRVASFSGRASERRGQRTGVPHTGVLTSAGLSGQPQVATTPGADAKALPHTPSSWLEQLPRSHSAHVHMLDDVQLEELSALAASRSPRVSPPSSPSRAQQHRVHCRGASLSQSSSRPSAFAAAAAPSSAAVGVQGAGGMPPAPSLPRTGTIKRSASSGAMESVCQHLSQVTTAGDVIRLAGYPLEVHNVTTDDGYILRMERIPRPGSRDAVFFMHGVLDTSMAWVSAGVTGSQAFAAWDSGFDVWLGNSRCNAPRLHQDPRKASTRVAYWRYSCNELGTQDVAAQLERLHNVKCTELGSGRVELDLDHLGPLAPVLLPDYRPPRRSSFSTATPTTSLPRRSSVSSTCETASAPPKAASFPPEPRLPPSHRHERGAAPSSSSLSSHPASQQRQARHLLHRISSHPLPMSSEDEEGGSGGGLQPRSPEEQQFPDLPQQQRQPKSHSSPAVGSANSEEDSGHSSYSGRPSASTASSLSSLTPSPSPSPTPTAAHATATPPTPQPPLPSPFSQPSLPATSDSRVRPDEQRAASAHSGSGSSGELEGEEVDEGPLPSWQSTLLGGIKRGTGLEQLGNALAPMGAAVRRSTGSATTGAARVGAASAALPTAGEGAGGVAGRERARSSRAASQASAAPLRLSSRRHHVTSEDTQRSGHSVMDRHSEPEPYRLRAVGHSLGGMSLLIHTVMAKAQGKPSRVHRLILFTPAGVHAQLPRVGYPIAWFLPPLVWLARLFWPSLAAPMYIPTTFARGLTFKLMADMRAIPSLAELLNLAFRGMLSGDASQWDRALQMPHYGAKAMPACSLNQCIHMAQIARTGRFRLFDYGTTKANEAAYGSPQPPDIVEQYTCLGDIPVDLVAGTRDGVIPPHNIRIHYEAMKAAGVQVTYREFDFGHLDFTFAVKEELKRFLMHSLRK